MLLSFSLSLALLIPRSDSPAEPPATEPPAVQSGPTAPAKPPCRNPDASGKYHIGCGVPTPIVIHQVEPKYPEEARALKLSTGGAVVTLTVDTNGNPTDVHVKNSKVDKVDKSARSAQQLLEVRQYKFKPATFEGKPVPIELNVVVFVDFF